MTVMTRKNAIACAFAAVAWAALAPAPAAPPYAVSHALPEPVVFAPGVISTGDDESHPTFTPDGRMLYFLRNTPLFDHWTVVVSRFVDGRWSTPEVAPFSGRFNDADVAFSPDGSSLYFISDRPAAPGGKSRDDTDVWMMRKTADGWSEARHLDAVSSPGYEWFPTVTDDGTLYFGSARRDGNRGPAGTSDLWRSRLVDGRYTEPENLGDVINTSGQDIEAWVAPDESYIIFSSKGRADSRGSYDLYISYRRGETWSEPQNLGDTVNSEGWEFGARMSPDGRYLFFTSNRKMFERPLERRLSYPELIDMLHSPGNGLRDIYQVDASVLPAAPDRVP